MPVTSASAAGSAVVRGSRWRCPGRARTGAARRARLRRCGCRRRRAAPRARPHAGRGPRCAARPARRRSGGAGRGGGVGGVRREEAEGAVAPVVGQALSTRCGSAERVHGQQLDCRDAQAEQVLDHDGVRRGRRRCRAGSLGQAGVQLVSRARAPRRSTVSDPRASRAVAGGVPRPTPGRPGRRSSTTACGTWAAESRGSAGPYGSPRSGRPPRARRSPGVVDLADEAVGVRVDQQLRGVVAQARGGLPGAVRAEPVPLSRPDPGHRAENTPRSGPSSRTRRSAQPCAAAGSRSSRHSSTPVACGARRPPRRPRP